jgi:hypothetical protein
VGHFPISPTSSIGGNDFKNIVSEASLSHDGFTALIIHKAFWITIDATAEFSKRLHEG